MTLTFPDANEFEWHFDHGASGDRLRAFTDEYTMVAYEDGGWCVTHRPTLHIIGEGNTVTQGTAQMCCIVVMTLHRDARLVNGAGAEK